MSDKIFSQKKSVAALKRAIFLFVLVLIFSGCASQNNSQNQPVLNPENVVVEEAKKPETEPPKEENKVSILFVGDIMLDRNVKKRIDENGPDYIFEKLGLDFLNGFDHVSANLEGPFANYRRETSKSIAFRFDPALIPVLKKYNFTLLSQANNHSLDMSRAGFEESKKNLSDAGLNFYGEEWTVGIEESVLLKEIKGIKFAFVGLDDTIRQLTEKEIKEVMDFAEKNSDYAIVNIHWGNEYAYLQAGDRQKRLGRLFVDTGADMVIGGHPHVIQEMEIYNGKPIFYSLGNFVFDQYFSENTQRGLGVAVDFYQDKEKNTADFYYFISENSATRTSTEEEAKNFWQEFATASELAEKPFAKSDFEL